MKTAKGLRLNPSERRRSGGLTLAERFWSHVDKSGECWLWTGRLNHRGYGTFAVRTRCSQLAHRVANVLESGPLEPGQLVLHRAECTTKACVRPAHTYRGDQKQNMADAVAAGVMHGRNVARGDAQWMRRDPDRVIRDAGGRVVGSRR